MVFWTAYAIYWTKIGTKYSGKRDPSTRDRGHKLINKRVNSVKNAIKSIKKRAAVISIKSNQKPNGVGMVVISLSKTCSFGHTVGRLSRSSASSCNEPVSFLAYCSAQMSLYIFRFDVLQIGGQFSGGTSGQTSWRRQPFLQICRRDLFCERAWWGGQTSLSSFPRSSLGQR